MNPFCSAGASFFEEQEDDGDSKGWFSDLLDMILMEPSQAQKKRAQRILSDDESFTSSDSKTSSSRRIFSRKAKTNRRKGNIKISVVSTR